MSYDSRLGQGISFGNLPRATSTEAISYRGCSAVRVLNPDNTFSSQWDVLLVGQTSSRIPMCDRPTGLIDIFKRIVDSHFKKNVYPGALPAKPFRRKSLSSIGKADGETLSQKQGSHELIPAEETAALLFPGAVDNFGNENRA